MFRHSVFCKQSTHSHKLERWMVITDPWLQCMRSHGASSCGSCGILVRAAVGVHRTLRRVRVGYRCQGGGQFLIRSRNLGVSHQSWTMEPGTESELGRICPKNVSGSRQVGNMGESVLCNTFRAWCTKRNSGCVSNSPNPKSKAMIRTHGANTQAIWDSQLASKCNSNPTNQNPVLHP